MLIVVWNFRACLQIVICMIVFFQWRNTIAGITSRSVLGANGGRMKQTVSVDRANHCSKWWVQGKHWEARFVAKIRVYPEAVSVSSTASILTPLEQWREKGAVHPIVEEAAYFGRMPHLNLACSTRSLIRSTSPPISHRLFAAMLVVTNTDCIPNRSDSSECIATDDLDASQEHGKRDTCMS